MVRWARVQEQQQQLREPERPEHAPANDPPPPSSPPSLASAPADSLAGTADHGTLARHPETGAAAHPARAVGRRAGGGLRRMRPPDIRQVLPSGGGQAVARGLPSVLPLPSGPRRRSHLFQQGRKHLLQEGLLSVSRVQTFSFVTVINPRLVAQSLRKRSRPIYDTGMIESRDSDRWASSF